MSTRLYYPMISISLGAKISHEAAIWLIVPGTYLSTTFYTILLSSLNVRKMGANKRKHPGDSTDELYSNKTRSKPSAIARVDPTYGQRSAIPLDDESGSVDDNGGLAYDEEMDALAYLRSVRLVNSFFQQATCN